MRSKYSTLVAVFNKKTAKPGSINLAKRMQKGVGDRFLTWAFTIGRSILMIVYAIALGAFAYRFGLDREIIDLGDKIKQQQALVSLSAESEMRYRDLQERLMFINTTEETAQDEIDTLDTIYRLATKRIRFTSLSITPTSIQMEGSAISINSLNSFIDDLRQMPEIESVSLGEIESRVSEGIIIFSVSATPKI